MSLVLDSGALVALERNERPMWIRLKAAQSAGDLPLTHAGVLGQVWRGGKRQARLSQALAGIDVRALDESLEGALALTHRPTVTSTAVERKLCSLYEHAVPPPRPARSPPCAS